jgi:hypothetical protein
MKAYTRKREVVVIKLVLYNFIHSIGHASRKNYLTIRVCVGNPGCLTNPHERLVKCRHNLNSGMLIKLNSELGVRQRAAPTDLPERAVREFGVSLGAQICLFSFVTHS